MPEARTRPPVVRPSRQGDASRLAAFFRDFWRESGPGALGFAGAKQESLEEIAAPEFLKRRLSSPVLMIVVAEDGPKIIGMATARKTTQRECEMVGIAVLKEKSGTGLDSRLARKTLELARKRGLSSVNARVGAADERAASFYRNAGFTESGKVSGTRRNSPMRVLEKRLA